MKQSWWDPFRWPLELQIRWEAGQTYFYRLETAAEPFRVVWRLAQIREEQVLSEIAECRFQPAADGGKLRKW